MGKAKKAKNAKMSQDRLNLKAKAAAGAAATAGRSRVFADKQDKLAKAGADPEIAEGLAEYEEKKAEKKMSLAEFVVMLPDPDKRGASEYRLLHEFVTDMVKDSEGHEDPMALLESSLDEMYSYLTSIRERVREVNRGSKPLWEKL